MGRSNTFVGKKKPAHGRWRVPVGVVATALVVGVTTGPAQAASDYTVPIPLHAVAADLRLIGASTVGVAVQQEDVNPEYPPAGPVYTGALGGELTRRPEVDPNLNNQQSPSMAAVSGNSLAWYENLQRAGSRPKTGHELNLLTGKDVVNPASMARPGAYNGDSWFSDEVLSFADFPGNWQRPLRRYRADGQTDILIPNVPGVSGAGLAADPTGVLRATRHDQDSGTSFALDLVNLKTSAVTRILEGPDPLVGLGISQNLLVWVTKAGDGYVIHQKPRAGGPVVTYTETDPHADLSGLAVGEGGIAYLMHYPADPENPYATSTGVAIVNGTEAVHDDLPYDASGLAAVGDSFLTASSGYTGSVKYASGRGGVYRITPGHFTQVASVPEASLAPTQLALSAGRLRYSDTSGPALPDYPVQPGRPVFERAVSGDRRAKFSQESEIARTSGEMSFSAGRGAVGVPDQRGIWQLLDRGEETGRVEALGTPNVSGPYVLIGGKVFRPDGERLYTEPAASGADDLFGAQVVYARSQGGTSTIWLDNAEHSAATSLATTTDACEGRRPQVSIWGESVAWSSSCGDQIFVRNLRTGVTRQVASGVGVLGGISLSEGTVAWSDDVYRTVRVMDLTVAASAPVLLPQYSSLFAVDGHQIARLVSRTPGYSVTRPELTPLPFQPKYLPRLIAGYTPLGFSPNGDGQGDTWKPQFDLTKPMRSVTLKITNAAGTRTVAQVDGTAADGSVRDLSWNGLSAKGAQQPTGLYRWTLTGRSADGDGTLINSDGTTTVSGTIELAL